MSAECAASRSSCPAPEKVVAAVVVVKKRRRRRRRRRRTMSRNTPHPERWEYIHTRISKEACNIM